MGLFQRLSDAVRGERTNAVRQEMNNLIHVNPQCSTAENVFAQALPLIDEMTGVFPYGVGRNGARLADNRTPELMILKDPNEEMGWAEFANLMFMSWLCESELNIHVHRNGCGRVIGYSVLPPYCRVDLGNGLYQFQVYTTDGLETLTKDEVMTLRFMRNPLNPYRGISPAGSVFTYTQIDDVMAQYIRAWFENGAVPASITFIKASTRERYENARRELEQNLHGARNKNKTIYVWRQMLDDGREADQLEVKTIQGNNSTQALKEIFDIVNTRINKAFGVSNFILGDDASAKYDNAELSDRQFTKRRVYPALMKFWSQFQHELDRITGGLGYAIQFDLEIPELTDRLKVKAEISEKNVANLLSLIKAGASPSASVRALGLGDAWEVVANGVYGRELEIREAEEAQAELPLLETKTETPEPEETTVDEHSHCCHHHDKTFTGTFTQEEISEKKIYDTLINLAENIAENSGNVDYETAVDEIIAVLRESAQDGGNQGFENLAAGADEEELKSIVTARLEEKGYVMSPEFADRMRSRTELLVNTYGEHTRKAFEEALTGAATLSQGEIAKKLSEVMPRKRAELIARNEVGYTFMSAQLEVEKSLSDELGLETKKIWRARHDSKTCPVCAAMDGQEVSVNDSFDDLIRLEDGQEVAWEQSEWNDYGEIPLAHPNCRCYYQTISRRRE